MAKQSNPGGWEEWSQYVLNELKRLGGCYEDLRAEMTRVRTNELHEIELKVTRLGEQLETLKEGALGKYMPYILLANIILWLIAILAGMLNIKLPGAP